MKVQDPHDLIRHITTYLESLDYPFLSEVYEKITYRVENDSVSENIQKCMSDISEYIDILENQDPNLERKVQTYRNLGVSAYILSILILDYTAEKSED